MRWSRGASMTIGVTEEHASLTEAVRGWVSRFAPIATAREAASSGAKERPPFWDALAPQGLAALHVPEARGRAGAGAVGLAVATEALGYGLVAGSCLPTVIASSALLHSGADDLVEELGDGSRTAAISFGDGPVLGAGEAD